MPAMAARSTRRVPDAASGALRIPLPPPSLLVFAATLALYLATLTGVHTFDALSYILDVQRKPLAELYHPHHLAYGPLGWLAYHGARALGYAGTANLPLQLVNAVAGALGVALFFRTLRRLTGLASLALAGAALLALSFAFWYYAVEVEVYTLAGLFLLLCLDRMARLLRRPSWQGFALLGVLQGLAILFHQTNLLLCAPVAALLLLCWQSGLPARTRGFFLELLLPYGLALGLCVSLPYALVARASGLTSVAELRGWLLGYATTGWWGGAITSSKWAGLGEGLSLTLAAELGVGAFVGLWLLGLLVIHLRLMLSDLRLRRRGRDTITRAVAQHGPSVELGLIAIACVWLLCYGAFFLWWEPDNVEFWIASLPPAILLLALALARGEGRWRRRPGVWTTLAIALTLGALNGEAIVRRGDPARDLQRQIVAAYVAASEPDDLLLVPDGLQELYLPYYEDRFAYASWNQAFFDHGPRWQEVCTAMQARIEAALHAGAAVIFADEVLRPPALLQRRHGFSTGEVDACLSPYLPDLEPLAMPSGQPGAMRLPGANERARGAGWEFAHQRWGWRALNAREAGVEGGWNLVPESDPALLSPALGLDASEFRALELVIDSGGVVGEGQLFWAGPDGQTDEARSLRWALRPAAAPQTYRLELAGQPGWAGPIARLRIDPLDVGDGRTLRVLAIRLLR
jgi:hypothetical protein